jgi:hypothetical protein
MTNLPPIIVTGTGRSGTSCVAGALHYLGVDMGPPFIPPNHRNPHGYFESVHTIEAGKLLEAGRIAASGYAERIMRRAGPKPWGFKDPRVAGLLASLSVALAGALWIVCERNRDDTIRSLMKTYDEPQARELFDRRQACINVLLASGSRTIRWSLEEEDPIVESLCRRINEAGTPLVPTPEQVTEAESYVAKLG